MVHGRERVHGDEDGVGQVGEDHSESSRRSVRRVRANDSNVSRLGGSSDTCRHQRFDRFGLKTGELVTSCGGVREGLTGLTSKPRETGLTGLASKPGETGLIGFDLKTGGGLDAVKVRAEGTWRHREACIEAKRSREGDVSVRGSNKKLDEITLRHVIGVVVVVEYEFF